MSDSSTAKGNGAAKGMTIHLKIWRQPGRQAQGRFVDYTVSGIQKEMSLLEMLDILNEDLIRKGEEAIITLMVEAVWSKRRIFEVYLNVIEWGNGVFGAEAAARHYYGLGAAQLGPEQAARLAAMVPSPRFYDRNRAAPGLARKAEVILARMPSARVP